MTITVPKNEIKVDFEKLVLDAWHEAHGDDAGHISSSWGEDRVVVMIEDVLFKGERLLSQTKRGEAILAQYVHQLMVCVGEDQTAELSKILKREIISTSYSADMPERWVMFIFKLEDVDGS